MPRSYNKRTEKDTSPIDSPSED